MSHEGAQLTATGDLITLAVLAVGGQGGGVLTNWIADLATRCDYAVQMTSVAGVAQRTGATIYYLEMAPKTSQQPIFALSPTPGDIDVLIAAELMEAGRAVLRGFVTPDRTTLIASTHRILAVSEKTLPGDGRAEDAVVKQDIQNAAFHSVCFDMEAIAASSGSMISASLFGGLARSGCLPFDVSHYEEVIKASGRGVAASLKAFHGALNYGPPNCGPLNCGPQEKDNKKITTAANDEKLSAPLLDVDGPPQLVAAWHDLHARINKYPSESQFMVQAGLVKVVDYQDLDYGREYLDTLEELSSSAEPLTIAAAKYIANAMCYDDIIRVADLKTRSSRQNRLRGEQEIPSGDIVHVTEYFHPRAQEICGTLPTAIGAWIETHPKAFSLLDRISNKGRRLRSDSVIGFSLLWSIAALKSKRRKFLRHRYESEHLGYLLDQARFAAKTDVALAIEIFKCQRLIKGYSDTHQRGHSKFSKVMAALSEISEQHDAAEGLRRLREAALADEQGVALKKALDNALGKASARSTH